MPNRGWRSSQLLSGDFSPIRATTEEFSFGGYDRLILLFAAVPASRYSEALSVVQLDFDLLHSQLDRAGRGYMVFGPTQ